ncbi:MAG: small multi-drug export protein [Clostridia bacterium]|nr:small multi-drug export protein [Clostridia bacterium]
MLGYIMVLLVSMVPVIELRGAIPMGLYAYDLSIVPVTLLAIIGNLLPVPFLVLFGGKVLHWLAGFEKLGKPFRKILELGEKKVQKMNKNAKRALFWGLFLFVAVPLPGTGAWTGSLIAITLGLDLKKSFPPISLGVLGAGGIIVTLFYFAPELFKTIVG